MSDDETLRALEQQVTELAERRVIAVATTVLPAITAALTVRPGLRRPYLATEIFSRPDVDTALTQGLSVASTGLTTVLTAAYWAGVRTGLARATTDLTALGVVLDSVPDPDPAVITAIVAKATTAVANARLDIAASVRGVYDPLAGLAPTMTTATVLHQVITAVDQAVRRLAVHARTSAAVAVHRGYTDAQLTAHRAAATRNTHLRLVKRWQVSAGEQCPACTALDGTEIDLADTFDPTATTDSGFRTPGVAIDLLGPPRHPHCRCRLVITTSTATRQLQKALDVVPPGGYTTLTATAIRAMPSTTYQTLTGFLTAAIERVRRLSQDVHRG